MVRGDLEPFFGEANRLLRQIKQSLCLLTEGGALTTTAGTTSPIPAGLKTVTIVDVTGSVVITLSDASTYTLSTTGEQFTQSAGIGGKLPAFTVTGSFKWYGTK
jgi:hypothetical protein